MTERKASLIHELNETEKYLSFWYRVGEDQKFVLYNQETKSLLNAHEFSDDVHHLPFSFPKSVTENGRFVSAIYPEEIQKTASESPTSTMPDALA